VAKLTCSISECPGDRYARGWCRAHYARWQRHGDPLAGRVRRGLTVDERFWRLVDQSAGPEGCWLWKGWIYERTGYGGFNPGDGESILAHRYAWEREHGPTPDGQVLVRRCPTRSCVNPAHREPGTQRDANPPTGRASRRRPERRKLTLLQRFEEKVDRRGPDECWDWTAAQHDFGYGVLRVAGKNMLAHRLSYELRHGQLQDEMVIRHSCDNPACVNPAHLLVGTHAENMADMAARGRANGGGHHPRRPRRERMRNPDRVAGFWEKVNFDGPVPAIAPELGRCWIWIGAADGKGYGILTWNGIGARATKVAYELEIGPVPEGAHMLHACDTPACVRPSHLRPGSHNENVADKVAKGRQTRGIAVNTAKLTEDHVRAIRAAYDQAEVKYGVVKALAAQYGVQVLAIHRIVARTTWKHLL
jgi:HNH endonuclease